MEDNQWVTVKKVKNETIIKVNGNFELIGFFPCGNGSNMAIMLKEIEKENSANGRK